MCLPRFNSSGFLHTYTNCLCPSTKLVLVLIGSMNTTEQFQLFRTAATKLREELGMPEESSSVLRITTSHANSDGKSADGDIEWHRSLAENSTEDEEYVDIASDGEHIIRLDTRECPLLEELRRSNDTKTIQDILEECVGDGSVIHFLFRVDVQVRGSSKQSANHKGTLSQCISPDVPFPFVNDAAKRRLWSCYHKLAVRLRLGSASVESTMDAFDMISRDETEAKDRLFPGIAKYCPAIGLLEAPPNNSHGVTYILDGNETFLAMNGRDFELYVVYSVGLYFWNTMKIISISQNCLSASRSLVDRYMVSPSSIPIKRVAVLGARLVRRLKADEKSLFLSNPPTWKD